MSGIEALLRQVADAAAGGIDPLDRILQTVIDTNVGTSVRLAVPPSWRAALEAYGRANAGDGRVLNQALARSPSFHGGGWILAVQRGAEAITLDTRVFTHVPLRIVTYAHELVHVQQYGLVGRSSFLTSYFGMSALEIARRFARREPLDVFTASPHEQHAYAVGGRFRTWLRTAHADLLAQGGG